MTSTSSREAGTCSAKADARALADSRQVFIFQLPARIGRLIKLSLNRKRCHRFGCDLAGAIKLSRLPEGEFADNAMPAEVKTSREI